MRWGQVKPKSNNNYQLHNINYCIYSVWFPPCCWVYTIPQSQLCNHVLGYLRCPAAALVVQSNLSYTTISNECMISQHITRIEKSHKSLTASCSAKSNLLISDVHALEISLCTVYRYVQLTYTWSQFSTDGLLVIILVSN